MTQIELLEKRVKILFDEVVILSKRNTRLSERLDEIGESLNSLQGKKLAESTPIKRTGKCIHINMYQASGKYFDK